MSVMFVSSIRPLNNALKLGPFRFGMILSQARLRGLRALYRRYGAICSANALFSSLPRA